MALGAGARDLTSSDVEAFTDGVMTAAMAQDHVAGAVVGIVADGQVVLLKGYGYSDIDRKIPV
ncbi:MAG TPA: serine hydrolase, partial [Pseudomonadales bacterium]|nr:serine hydrolase [Pseudomonadales bacterium]